MLNPGGQWRTQPASVTAGHPLSVAVARVTPDQHGTRISGDTGHATREEMIVIEGTLITESLRVGTDLEDLNLTVRKISRHRQDDAAPGEPEIWTLLEFEADETVADHLAQTFAGVLDDQPTAWYIDFRSPAETFVVFPGRIFRYPRGDHASRAEAEAHGRQLAIPESQLDWPV
jgi:hypothetical protein